MSLFIGVPRQRYQIRQYDLKDLNFVGFYYIWIPQQDTTLQALPPQTSVRLFNELSDNSDSDQFANSKSNGGSG